MKICQVGFTAASFIGSVQKLSSQNDKYHDYNDDQNTIERKRHDRLRR